MLSTDFLNTVSPRGAQFTCGIVLVTILLTGVIDLLVSITRSSSDLRLRLTCIFNVIDISTCFDTDFS